MGPGLGARLQLGPAGDVPPMYYVLQAEPGKKPTQWIISHERAYYRDSRSLVP